MYCYHYYLLLSILIFYNDYIFECGVIQFSETTNSIIGYRSAGKASQDKQRNVWRRISRIANNERNIQNDNSNQECDDCLKKGSGDIRIKRVLDNTNKKQYSRGIENRITFNIINSKDVPLNFYHRPYIDSHINIMKSLIYSIGIEESPLSEQTSTTPSAKQAAIKKSWSAVFRLSINTEQPLTELSKIQKDYNQNVDGIIAKYNSLNGIKTLPHSEGVDISKFIENYQLNKPYYSRKAVGDIPIKICNNYGNSLKCINKYLINFDSTQDQELNKNIGVFVNYPLIPGEHVIAPLLSIKLDSPSIKHHSTGYKKWWDCYNQELSGEHCKYKLLTTGKQFYANQPIQGTLRIGKGQIDGNWQQCGKKSYRNKNRKKCSIKLKNIWPSTVSRIKIELMHHQIFK